MACCRDFGVSGSRVVGGIVPVRGRSGVQPGGIAIGVPLDQRVIPARGITSSTVRTWEMFSTSCGLRQRRKVKRKEKNE